MVEWAASPINPTRPFDHGRFGGRSMMSLRKMWSGAVVAKMVGAGSAHPANAVARCARSSDARPPGGAFCVANQYTRSPGIVVMPSRCPRPHHSPT